MLPLLLDGKKLRDYRKLLDEILGVIGLTERRKHTPRELWEGQQSDYGERWNDCFNRTGKIKYYLTDSGKKLDNKKQN